MPNSFGPRLAFIGLLISITTIISIGALWFSSQPENGRPTATKPTVAATIFPLADIARHIAGPHLTVIQLLPYGASEHAYSLTPQQILNIQTSKALFAIGHGLDVWATEPISRITTLPLVVVDEGITLRKFGQQDDHDARSSDPHYWLTTPNAKQIAATIASNLSEVDPAHASDFKTNLEQYSDELDSLEKELQQQAKEASPKEFIAMHDAWSYFADHYGLHLVATYEPVEGREPSIADLNRLREIIEKYNINIFYSEPQKQSTGAIRLLRDEFGLTIRILDPLGGIPPYDSYVNLMRANMSALTD